MTILNKKTFLIAFILLIVVHILSLVFYNYKIKSFVNNSNLEDVESIDVVFQDKERDLKVFLVSYGEPQDCPSGCIYSKMVGIKYNNKIGWVNTDSGNSVNIKEDLILYKFDDTDSYLLSHDFLVSVREQNKWLHDYYILPIFNRALTRKELDQTKKISPATNSNIPLKTGSINNGEMRNINRQPCTSSDNYTPSIYNTDESYTVYINQSNPEVSVEVCFSGEPIERQTGSGFWLIHQTNQQPFTVEDILPTDISKIYGYDDESFYIKGKPVYTKKDGSFKIFRGENGDEFLLIGAHIYGFSPIGLGYDSLHEIKGVDINTFEYIGGCYGKDKNSIFCSYSSEPLTEVSSSSFGISKFKLNQEPLGIDGEKLFFKQTWLSGLDASETILDDNYIYDSDTLWYITGGCDWPYFKKGELDKKDSYYNC